MELVVVSLVLVLAAALAGNTHKPAAPSVFTVRGDPFLQI